MGGVATCHTAVGLATRSDSFCRGFHFCRGRFDVVVVAKKSGFVSGAVLASGAYEEAAM